MFYFHKSPSFASGVEKVWKHTCLRSRLDEEAGGADAHTLGPGASGWVGGGAGVAIITETSSMKSRDLHPSLRERDNYRITRINTC